MKRSWPVIPASFFGMVLGLVGMGDCWRLAHKAWDMPEVIGLVVMLSAFVVWFVLLVLYVGKWIWARDEAIAEMRHPIQSCFVGLAGVATMLAAVAIGPQAHDLAVVLFVVGAIAQVAYGVYFTGGLWMGDRDLGTATPALYLPTVAANFVAAFVAGYLGFIAVGGLFLGAGLLSWLSLESIVSHRLSFHQTLALPLRPTLGIMLAPPAVGLIAYMFLTGGVEGAAPDLLSQVLLGYALVKLLLLLRLMPFILKQPFGASFWAFSFGVTALAFDAVLFVIRGETGYIQWVAGLLFLLANIVIAVLVIGTVRLLVAGRLVPAPLLAPVPVA